MVALTYTILTGLKSVDGSIKARLNHSDVPSSDVLADAEAWINTRLRIEEMVSRSGEVLGIGVDKIAVPTGFLDPVSLHLVDAAGNNLGRIKHRAKYEVIDDRNEDASGDATSVAGPVTYAVVGKQFLFDAAADVAYTVRVTFYAKPTALSGSNATNIYTDDFRTLLRHAYLIFGYEWRKDDVRMREQLAFAMSELNALHVADDLNTRGSSYNTEVTHG